MAGLRAKAPGWVAGFRCRLQLLAVTCGGASGAWPAETPTASVPVAASTINSGRRYRRSSPRNHAVTLDMVLEKVIS
jgi:hypothetical protein